MPTSLVSVRKMMCNFWYKKNNAKAPNKPDHITPPLHAHDVLPDPLVGTPSMGNTEMEMGLSFPETKAGALDRTRYRQPSELRIPT